MKDQTYTILFLIPSEHMSIIDSQCLLEKYLYYSEYIILR